MRAGGGDDLPSANYLPCAVTRRYSRELCCTPMEFINSENAASLDGMGRAGRSASSGAASARSGPGLSVQNLALSNE
jgi:hypothetical protein